MCVCVWIFSRVTSWQLIGDNYQGLLHRLFVDSDALIGNLNVISIKPLLTIWYVLSDINNAGEI